MTTQTSAYKKISEASDFIRTRTKIQPQLGLVLGSGLGEVGNLLEETTSISYSEIPHFHPTAVEGHAGKLLIGKFHGASVAILQGRFHAYEGYSMQEVVFPVRVLCQLGIHSLILTNAAGGINTRFRPGDLMIITDHLNLTGDNPLKGPNLSELGPRFPDLSEPYDAHCNEILTSASQEADVAVQKGIYAGLLGPTYETPAEVRMLRTLGADATGMSTVYESIAANHIGIRVAGISCITNAAAGLSPHKLSHDEVIETSKTGAEKMIRLLKLAIPRIAQLGPRKK